MGTILFSNYDPNFDEIKVQLEELHEGEEISDQDVWDEINFNEHIMWSDLMETLGFFLDGGPVIFAGTVGLWNGMYTGGRIGAFKEILPDALKDCDLIEIEDVDGHLLITGDHHDGRVSYEVKKVTDAGFNFYDNWQYNYEDKRTEKDIFELIMNNSNFSKIPNIAEKMKEVNHG